MVGFKDLMATEEKRRAEREANPALALVPKTVRVTEDVLNKAFTLCQLVKEVHEESMEWYGFLLAKRTQPELACDFTFGKQDSSAGHTKMSGEDIAKCIEEIESSRGKEWIINGWIHSHAGFNTFFSGTDQENRMTVLNSVYANTRRQFQRPYQFMQGEQSVCKLDDTLMLSSASPTDPVVIVSGEDAKSVSPELLQKIFKSRMLQEAWLGFSYSIVVNEKREAKGFVNWREWRTVERYASYDKNELNTFMDIERVSGLEYALVVDTEELKKKIKADITPPYHALGITHWGRTRHPVGGPVPAAGSQQTAEMESGEWNDYWEFIFGKPGTEVLPAPATLSEVVGQPVQARPTEWDVRIFLATALDYAGRQRNDYERAFGLLEILRDAVRESAGSLDREYQSWLLKKANAPKWGGGDNVMYELVMDEVLVIALTGYAASHPRFAKLMAEFQGNMWNKHGAIRRYNTKIPNKNAEIKPEKKDDDKGNGNGGAKPGLGAGGFIG